MEKFENAEKHRKIMARHAWIFMLTGAVILFQVYFVVCSYSNYKDKMHILEQMAELDEEDSVDAAIRIIKSEQTQQMEFVRAYGLEHSFQNRYYTAFIRQCAAMAAALGLFFMLILAAAYWQEKNRDRQLQAYMESMGRYLKAFREHDGNKVNLPPVLEGFETAARFLNEQLEMSVQYMLQAEEKAYQEKEKTKSMVTDISHQLKTPVAALDTCFTILEDPQLQEAEKAEFYGRCRNELEGLKTLLDALIQISRLESGLIQIKCRKSLLSDTVLAAVNRIYPRASEKRIELLSDFGPQTEQLEVMQDENWLCEALVNVLDNAVKYSPCGSKIQIGIQKGIRFARIEIADQGIGIAGKDFHKVFRRFYRGSSELVRAQAGSGVGLYLVREIIDGHQGTVMVKSGYFADTAWHKNTSIEGSNTDENGMEEKKGRLEKSRQKEFPGSVFVIQIPLAF